MFARLLAAALLASVTLASAAEPVSAPAELVQPRDGLRNVITKLAAGETVRVAYFGGSITAAQGWRVKTLAGLKQQYPKATLEEINAAIGGTGSDLGVFRYQQDVLDHKPNLVFVEFSVNDGGAPAEQMYRTMEGIVRKTWQADPQIDLCFIYTFRTGYEEPLMRGQCPPAAAAHEQVAAHYGIPSINVALQVVKLAEEGKLVYKADKGAQGPEVEGKIIFSNDGVHPLDAGHDIYARVIADALRAMSLFDSVVPHALPPPMRDDNWQSARLAPITEAMLGGNWQKLDPQQGLAKRFADRLPVVWEGSAGDTLKFRFKGTMVGLYDLLGPDGGQVRWTIDGRSHGPRPRFDSYCTYHRLASLRMADGLDDTEHEVTLVVDAEQPDRRIVTDKIKDQPNFDPTKFDGTKVWVGAIMMLGEPR